MKKEMKNVHFTVVGSLTLSLTILAFGGAIAHMSRSSMAREERPQGRTNVSRVARASGLIAALPLDEPAGRKIALVKSNEFSTSYTGSASKRDLESGAAKPLSLGEGDLDEDGMPDVVSGYTSENANFLGDASKGIGAKASSEDAPAPLQPSAEVFAAPVRPDVIGTGDFNADGHWDVVSAQLGGASLYWMPGDGHGSLGEPRTVRLPGIVTAASVGEINRADGLQDVVVAIDSDAGPRLLVFEGPAGALEHDPEIIVLPAPATSIVLGQLDDGYEMDVAVASGNNLVAVKGRDRKLSLSEDRRSQVEKPDIENRQMPFEMIALTIGRFNIEDPIQIAALSPDGVVHVIGRDKKQSWGRIADEVSTPRLGDAMSANVLEVKGSMLVTARVSVSGFDDIVLTDTDSNRIHIIPGSHQPHNLASTRQTALTPDSAINGVVSLDVYGAPVAMLPMRLNGDAFSDLVILKQGGESPLALSLTAPARIFTVNSSGDQVDLTPGDGKCETAANNGQCTFRAALGEAQAGPGGDTINFSGVTSITLTGGGNFIGKAVTIDGGSSRVEISGGNGLYIDGGNSVVRGLVLNKLTGAAIILRGNAGNYFIEGNYIGTDASGANTSYGSSSWSGISLGSTGSPNNTTIGGTVAAARNVISTPSTGINVGLVSGTKIQGNYLGTDAQGTKGLGSGSGIALGATSGALNQIIGGTAAGAGNLISCVPLNGSLCTNLDLWHNGTLVQGNLIGTNISGTAAVGSKSIGIQAAAITQTPAATMTIGGTTPTARNIISGHAFNSTSGGIMVAIPFPVQIQGNYIGTDISGTQAIGNSTGVYVTGGSGSGGAIVGGSLDGARNVISGNSNVGVYLGTGGSSTNLVQGNYIGTDKTGIADLGNGSGIFINGSNNLVGGTNNGLSNIIAFTKLSTGVNQGSGVRIFQGTGNSVRRNSMLGNIRRALLNDGNDADKSPVLSGNTGTLTAAAANKTFTIEFFSNSTCSSPGTEQAKTYIGELTVTTNASGNATFNIPAGQFITATATGQSTSTVSNCVDGVAPPPESDLELRFDPTLPPPQTNIRLDQTTTYNLIVTNNGPSKAFGLTVTGDLPANSTLGTGTSNLCLAAGSGTTYTCTLGDLDPAAVPHATSGTGVIKLDLVLKPGTLGPNNFTSRVNLDTSKSADPLSSNNSIGTITRVVAMVEMLGFEVTQAIQDLQNSVPLIADKSTFIRVYLGKDPVTPAMDGLEVSASLVGSHSNGVTNGRLPASNPGGRIKLLRNAKRGVLLDSFYFQLPADWVKAGTLQFKIESPELFFLCAEPDGSPYCSTTVTFQKMKKLSINLIGVTWKDAASTVHSPALDDLQQTANEIRARFPLDDFDLEVSSTTIPDNPCAVSIGTILNRIMALRMTDVSNGKAVKKFYMGLLPDQSACGAAYDGTNGAAFRGDSSSVAFLRRNGLEGTRVGRPIMDGNARAHELEHCMDIRHTDSGLGELNVAGDFLPADGRISTGRAEYAADTAYGFDVYDSNSNRDGARIFLPDVYDSMSYQRPRWMSVHNYRKLFGAIGVATASSAPEIAPKSVAVTQSVVVSGNLSPTSGTGTIGPLFVKTTNGDIPVPTPGTYEIRLETAAGQLIATHSFEPLEDADGGRGSFSLVLPWDPAAKRIKLVHNGAELAARQASPNIPSVTVIAPNGGEVISGTSATFSWTSADADGDPLSYVIDYSADSGTTWSALATGVTSTVYTTDLTTLTASANALIRVTASDGFNSTTDASNAVFNVSPHAPSAAIVSPEANHLYVADQTIILNGTAIDTEDGILAGSRLSWTSNLNGQLGTGNSLSINASTLQEGTHTITLSATDSTSRTGTANISIRVFRIRPVFPAVLSAGPTNLFFDAAVGSGFSQPQVLAIRNTGDGNLTWSATADQPWINLEPGSGNAPANPSVTINAAGLASGNYSGKITFTSPNDPNGPRVVDVIVAIIAPVSLSGRVVGPDGRALRGAQVTITDSANIRREAASSSLGFFSFSDLKKGGTYTIRISSKRYRFSSRTLQVTNDVTVEDFVGLE
jgi:hypothetical protein